MNIMMNMEYGNEHQGVLYHTNLRNGFQVAIINRCGSHPCGYIRIPDDIFELFLEEHGEDVYNYDNWHADVHGGFTYSGEQPHESLDKGFWLGWEYAHFDDYTYIPDLPDRNGKKWTTREIYKEALECISTLGLAFR